MRNSTAVGIIIFVVLAFGLTGFIFSQIVIEPVFADGISGTEAFAQSGMSQTTLLSWIMGSISDAIGNTITSIFSW